MLTGREETIMNEQADENGVMRVFHFHKPDSPEFLCGADDGFTTTHKPNVTCPACLEWLHA